MKVSQLLLISALIIGLPIASHAAEIPVAPAVDAIAVTPANLTNAIVKWADSESITRTVRVH